MPPIYLKDMSIHDIICQYLNSPGKYTRHIHDTTNNHNLVHNFPTGKFWGLSFIEGCWSIITIAEIGAIICVLCQVTLTVSGEVYQGAIPGKDELLLSIFDANFMTLHVLGLSYTFWRLLVVFSSHDNTLCPVGLTWLAIIVEGILRWCLFAWVSLFGMEL
jgi:hypothetical protein